MKRRMRIYFTDFKNWLNAFYYSIIYLFIVLFALVHKYNQGLFSETNQAELGKILIAWLIFIPVYMVVASFVAAIFPKKHVEPKSAKIRNKLSPYWNLVAMIKEYDKEKNEELFKYIMKEVKNIEEKQDVLLEIVDSVK